jgi:hypothetical protein
MTHCPHCHGPLIEIDYYGERLIGCIECNRRGLAGEVTNPSWRCRRTMSGAEGQREAGRITALPKPQPRLPQLGHVVAGMVPLIRVSNH